jgi:transposase
MLTLEKQRDLQERNELLVKELGFRDKEIIYLQRQIAALKRHIFGAAKNEKISDEQMRLAFAELEKESVEQRESEKETVAYTRSKPKPKEAASRIPEDIEVVREEIIPEHVRENPEGYQRMGEEVTEELDIVPMRFVKRQIVRPKFVAKGLLDAKPVIAPLPARLIPGGLPAAGLVAFLIVSKFADHLPLYRLERIFGQRFGVGVARQRMCDWIGYAVDNWLSVIYHSIRKGLIDGDYLQVDETPIRYLDADRKGKSHKGYFWVFGRPGGDVCFDWRLGRGAEGAKAIAKDFEGWLQSDGYKVYDTVCADRPIQQVRPTHDASSTKPGRTASSRPSATCCSSASSTRSRPKLPTSTGPRNARHGVASKASPYSTS